MDLEYVEVYVKQIVDYTRAACVVEILLYIENGKIKNTESLPKPALAVLSSLVPSLHIITPFTDESWKAVLSPALILVLFPWRVYLKVDL